tara:strand:+ start:2971 stop:3741 length:771 start_codon:yes stop_codon:yes gene_type:complete
MISIILKPIYKFYEWMLQREVIKGAIPTHIGIIMDGNRRLAENLGLKPWEGHKLGAEKVADVLTWCLSLNIKTITAYAFSTENFNRPKEELDELFDLFEEYFNKLAKEKKVHDNKIKIKAIGRIDLFPPRVRDAIKNAENLTSEYNNSYLNLAVAYGGRQEVLDAVKKIAENVKNGLLELDLIDEKTIGDNLYTNGSPDPDLIIRTSGEWRISGFLLWQSAYSELYFCESYWPLIRKIDFLRAIRAFQRRKRRFGR